MSVVVVVVEPSDGDGGNGVVSVDVDVVVVVGYKSNSVYTLIVYRGFIVNSFGDAFSGYIYVVVVADILSSSAIDTLY